MNFVRNICESSDQEEKDEEDLIFESGGGGEELFQLQLGEDSINAEIADNLRGVEPTASVLRQSLSDPPHSSPKLKGTSTTTTTTKQVDNFRGKDHSTSSM